MSKTNRSPLRSLTVRRMMTKRPRKAKGQGDDKNGTVGANQVRTEIGSILAIRKLGPEQP